MVFYCGQIFEKLIVRNMLIRVSWLIFQSRAALEKAKQTLEAENVDMANEIKQISVARQESERRRKQIDQQVCTIIFQTISIWCML